VTLDPYNQQVGCSLEGISIFDYGVLRYQRFRSEQSIGVALVVYLLGSRRSRAMRHGYPWSPPTRLTAVPDKWVRPARGPADLTCGSEDEKTTWRARQDSLDGLRQLE
jgi:hypothetical protein